MSYAILIVVAAVGFSAVMQIVGDRRLTGAFMWKSVLALALFFLYGFLGVFIVGYVLPHFLPHLPPPTGDLTVAAVGTIVAWICLGGLGLMRLAPRTREPPHWLMHFGTADLVCLGAIVAGIGWTVSAGWQ